MTPIEFASLVLLGFFVGNVSSFFGVGGGAFLVPALVRFGGLPWEQAIALSLVQIVPTSALGAWQRFKHNEVLVSLAIATLGGTLPGSWIGKSIVAALADRGMVEIAGRSISLVDTCLSLAFSGMLLFMAWRMFRPTPAPAGGTAAETESPRVSRLEALLIGLAVGMVSALLGIGGGFLFVPIAVQRFRLPVVMAVGTSLFQMPITSAFASALYIFGGTPVPYLWLVPILAGSFAGVMTGIALSRRFNNKQYRQILAGMLAFISLMMFTTWIRKVL